MPLDDTKVTKLIRPSDWFHNPDNPEQDTFQSVIPFRKCFHFEQFVSSGEVACQDRMSRHRNIRNRQFSYDDGETVSIVLGPLSVPTTWVFAIVCSSDYYDDYEEDEDDYPGSPSTGEKRTNYEDLKHFL